MEKKTKGSQAAQEGWEQASKNRQCLFPAAWLTGISTFCHPLSLSVILQPAGYSRAHVDNTFSPIIGEASLIPSFGSNKWKNGLTRSPSYNPSVKSPYNPSSQDNTPWRPLLQSPVVPGGLEPNALQTLSLYHCGEFWVNSVPQPI